VSGADLVEALALTALAAQARALADDHKRNQ